MIVKTGVIDRFEGDTAIVEVSGGMVSFKREQLPAGTHEGDVIIISGKRIMRDKKETARRRAEIKTMFKNLLE